MQRLVGSHGDRQIPALLFASQNYLQEQNNVYQYIKIHIRIIPPEYIYSMTMSKFFKLHTEYSWFQSDIRKAEVTKMDSKISS